jgi:uncharacterized protein (DUF58 family)
MAGLDLFRAMEPTRQWWTVAGIGLFLSGFAVVLARPVLLVGVVGLGGFLLARQYRFLRVVQAVEDRLDVEQSVSEERVASGRPVRVDLEAAVDGDGGPPCTVRIEARPPVAATGDRGDERTVRLSPATAESDRARTTFDVRVPAAGVQTFGVPRVTLTSADGLFRTAFETGTRPTVVVEPPRPGAIHVGEGGDRVGGAIGEHASGDVGSGFEPAGVRAYQPGDPARRIDWKASARLGEPHVQEFEAETERVVTMLVDHRESMGAGPEGETKLDYAREIALGFVANARERSDPLGLYAVGNDGMTEQRPPHSDRGHYGRLRSDLQALTPTPATGPPTGIEQGPRDARTAATELAGDDTAFGQTLLPYFDARERYVERLDGNPLFETGGRMRTDTHGARWTVLISDDTDRAGVRETVDAVRRRDAHVLVFLLPTVLFEPGGLADLEGAYDRYRAFEEFRQTLESLPRVSAFEVGPRDRIDAVLEARRRRSRSGGG